MSFVHLSLIQKEHKHTPGQLTGLTIDFTTSNIKLANNDPVSVWVAHKAKRRGKVRRIAPSTAAGSEFVTPAFKTWLDLVGTSTSPAAPSVLTPSLPGIYTIVLVGINAGKPATYRSAPIKVVP